MSKSWKRKYKGNRSEFKAALEREAETNCALPIAIIKTYTASKHREHIMKIWSLLGNSHREAYTDYCSLLMGNHLTGHDDIFHSLYFAAPKIYAKFVGKIPSSLALGDAVSVAKKVELKKRTTMDRADKQPATGSKKSTSGSTVKGNQAASGS